MGASLLALAKSTYYFFWQTNLRRIQNYLSMSMLTVVK